MSLFCNIVLSYFAKPNFIVYDEWFDNDLKKTKLNVKNKKITNISNIHEFFYEQSNYKVGASENNLQIDIDENSLGKFGQFPWNRKVFADILDKINESNPKAIGFDIFFTEKDKQSPDEIIKSYGLVPSDIAELQNLQSPDEIFSDKLNQSKSIIAVLGSNVPSHSNYDRKAKARFLSKGGDPKQFTYKYPYSIGSLEKLEQNVKGLGSISFLDQLDGIIRSLPLIVQFDKKLYPTMGLEMVRVGAKQKNVYIELNEVGIKRISTRPYKINSDPNGIISVSYTHLTLPTKA